MRMLGKPKGRPKKKRAKADKPDQSGETRPAEEKQTQASGAPGKRRTREQLREDALRAIRASKGLTKATLRKELHCSGATLTRVLDDLVARGEIGVKGEKRRARYHRLRSEKNDAEDALNEAVREATGA